MGHLMTTCPSKLGVRDLEPVGQIWSTPSFINKVLLAHNHPVRFHVIYSCFYAATAEMRSHDRDWPTKLNIDYLPLYWKSLWLPPTPHITLD